MQYYNLQVRDRIIDFGHTFEVFLYQPHRHSTENNRLDEQCAGLQQENIQYSQRGLECHKFVAPVQIQNFLDICLGMPYHLCNNKMIDMIQNFVQMFRLWLQHKRFLIERKLAFGCIERKAIGCLK